MFIISSIILWIICGLAMYVIDPPDWEVTNKYTKRVILWSNVIIISLMIFAGPFLVIYYFYDKNIRKSN